MGVAVPISAADRQRLARARKKLSKARERLGDTDKQLTKLQADLGKQRAAGARQTIRDRLKQRIANLRTDRGRLRAEVETASDELLTLRGTLFDSDPTRFVGDMDARTPIAMLPVRLEYRYFVGNPTELKIRIYPQELQIDDHQESLDSGEINSAKGFWQAVVAARATGGDETAVWEDFARQHRPGRARWIAEKLRPGNLDAADQATPLDYPSVEAADDAALDAHVRCLPERWAVLGYRDGSPVVRAWSKPVDEALTVNLTDEADDPDAPDINDRAVDDDGQPPRARGLDWLVDYDTAVDAGMAITLTDADDGQISQGYDELIVVGVDWSRDAGEGADALEALLESHRFEQGIELPTQAEPTNLDEEDTDADALIQGFDDRQIDNLNPLAAPVTVSTERDGALMNGGLGLSPSSPLLSAPGADRAMHQAQADMLTLLFEGTLGYFADQMLDPMLSDADIGRLKRHFIQFVRPLGAIPLLRVGDQPYGILPVCDSRRFTAAQNNISGKVQRETNAWRGYWQSAARKSVPRIGSTRDVDEDLLNALRMSARSTDFRIREAVGPTMVANFANMQSEHAFQETAASIWMQLGNYADRPFLADTALSRLHHRVRLPFVQRGDKSKPLTTDYLTDIAGKLRSTGGFEDMLKAKLEDPGSILEAIATHSALLELAKSAARLSITSDASRFKVSRLVARDREINGLTDKVVPSEGIALVSNALDRQPAVAANRSVVDEVARLLRDGSSTPNIEKTVLNPARHFEQALTGLSGFTVGELETLLTSALDSLSHRLDCWMSSLANQRLSEMRKKRARGLLIGGFGWLDDVKPAPRDTGFGMTLAPSMNHAKAAAVLKSAHAAHAGDDKDLLAVDLSSARVRQALKLVEGLRQGQSAGALLGYRLERDLKQRRLSLVQYVGPLRRIAPLGRTKQTLPGTPLETIEARDVVDGLRILELWKESPNFFSDHADLPQGGRDQADLRRAFEALDDTLDALNDLMLAESVYQYVNGNTERAAAALDSLERQSVFPEPEIAATPRSAAVYHHRLLVALADRPLPQSWSSLPAIRSEPRANADPRINSWLAQLLGDPAKYEFSGSLFVDLQDTRAGVRRITRQEHEKVVVNLLDLELHPAALVSAATTPSADKPSELEARIERALRAKVVTPLPANTVGTQMVIHGAPETPEAIGFAGFSLLVQQMAGVLGSAEIGDARSLASDDGDDPGFDTAEFAQRVESARASFVAAANGLDPTAAAVGLRRQLANLASHGVQNALPAERDEHLQAQAEQVKALADVTLDRLAEHSGNFSRGTATALQQVAHDSQTLKILYGENFVALPLCQLVDSQEQAASLANASQLVPGGPSDVDDWLRLHAAARPSVARLTELLDNSDLAKMDEPISAGSTEVIQLPHNPEEQWVGLPLKADLVRPKANLSILVHHSGDSLDASAAQALMVIDGWEDRIPDVNQSSAVTFQYDAPNAQAPQTILLAVPPLRDQKTWSFNDVVGAVREAKELGEIRMADLAHIDLLPRMLPALYFPFDLDEDSITLNFGHTIEIGSLMNALNR